MKKLSIGVLVFALFLLPVHVGASTVFETTGWVTDMQGFVYDFTADQSPYTYRATLTDLSVAPAFGFDFLFVSITTSTEVLDSLTVVPGSGQGSLIFNATPGTKYFANVFGVGLGDYNSGNFGLIIQSVPIPTSLLLLGSGLIGIVGIRKKFMKSSK